VKVLESSRSFLQRVPLRVTLVIALVLLAAVGLTATGAVVTAQLKGYLVDQVDQDLTRLAGSNRGPDLRGGPDDGDNNPFEASRDEYYALASPQGSIASVNEYTTNNAAPPDLTADAIVRAAGKGPFDVGASGVDDQWRVIVRRTVAQEATTGQPVPALSVRGISLNDVEDTTHRLVLVELLVGAVVLLLLGGLAYVVVRTSLRPLREVEATAAEIAAGAVPL
jgi:two-component system OmpR family sensor kinase